jgi:pimeloyl-ACP methyl ester carboxylesterase
MHSKGITMGYSSAAARALACVGVAFACGAYAQDKFVAIEGAQCATPPPLHCPASECSGPLVINQGPVVEMKTRRPYFLDYPCDLKPGEQVTFIMSLHGGGSYGNWHRNYFPLMDYKEKHRLVIATPNTPTRQWDNTDAAADDAYLQNIANKVLEQLGKNNVQVKSFWLVGHSWGGVTSNRLLRTEFFKKRVDGFLSLSGGRIGGQPEGAGGFGPGAGNNARPAGAAAAGPGAAAGASGAAGGAARPAGGPGGGATNAGFALLGSLPDADFSFIYETGRREMGEKGFPATSDWAKKYGCGEKVRRADIVDTVAGYVYDSSRLNTLNASWGLLPAAGTSEVFEYPSCKDGRIVFDVQRINKGHTEGLEPKITEYLIGLILSAKGGKLAQLKST